MEADDKDAVNMTSSAEIGILSKVIELAKRCGLKASQVDGQIGFITAREGSENGLYVLSFCDPPPEVSDKTDKFFELLGMRDTFTRQGPELEDLEDALDRALSLAPRARAL